MFSERYLQIIWNERLLCAAPMCQDGRTLRIVSGGLWNRGKGPDFQGAALLLGDQLRRGDVELHRLASEWFAHRHHQDPAYSGVILHVVWEDDLGGRAQRTGLPTLELKSQLQRDWEKFLLSVEAAFYPHAREIPPGACSLQWALSDDSQLSKILTAAGTARFLRHGREIMRRGLESSVEQSLYESLFESLGYASNRQQFRSLARALPLTLLRRLPQDMNSLGAVFFGCAGLLPDSTKEKILPSFREWVARAWMRWWQSGLPPAGIEWNPNGGRPMNSVFRRLAAGVLWLCECESSPVKWLDRLLIEAGHDGRRMLASLLSPFDTALEPWCGALDFGCALKKGAALLGESRRREMALNVLLPFLGARAELDGDEAAKGLAIDAWLRLPRMQENTLLKKSALRFLSPPSRLRTLARRAAQQQGLMDIFQNFCLALDHACADCPFVVGISPTEGFACRRPSA